MGPGLASPAVSYVQSQAQAFRDVQGASWAREGGGRGELDEQEHLSGWVNRGLEPGRGGCGQWSEEMWLGQRSPTPAKDGAARGPGTGMKAALGFRQYPPTSGWSRGEQNPQPSEFCCLGKHTGRDLEPWVPTVPV